MNEDSCSIKCHHPGKCQSTPLQGIAFNPQFLRRREIIRNFCFVITILLTLGVLSQSCSAACGGIYKTWPDNDPIWSDPQRPYVYWWIYYDDNCNNLLTSSGGWVQHGCTPYRYYIGKYYTHQIYIPGYEQPIQYYGPITNGTLSYIQLNVSTSDNDAYTVATVINSLESDIWIWNHALLILQTNEIVESGISNGSKTFYKNYTDLNPNTYKYAIYASKNAVELYAEQNFTISPTPSPTTYPSYIPTYHIPPGNPNQPIPTVFYPEYPDLPFPDTNDTAWNPNPPIIDPLVDITNNTVTWFKTNFPDNLTWLYNPIDKDDILQIVNQSLIPQNLAISWLTFIDNVLNPVLGALNYIIEFLNIPLSFLNYISTNTIATSIEITEVLTSTIRPFTWFCAWIFTVTPNSILTLGTAVLGIILIREVLKS